MPKFSYRYRARTYVVEAADRRAGYQIVLAQAKELAAANKAAKEAKMKHSMTCQCCGRAIFAATGVIAHHGYERPGYGYQTASCMGARHLPFEADRAQLGKLIEHLRDMHARYTKARAAIAAETSACMVEVPDKDKPAKWGRSQETKAVPVTRATFDAFRTEHGRVCVMRSLHDFDVIKTRELAFRDNTLKHLKSDIDTQQARFDGWKQTHKWEDDMWVRV